METFYMLVDRKSSRVSPLWKGLHIISLAVVIMSGYVTASLLGTVFNAFGDNCVLFAKLTFFHHNASDVGSTRTRYQSLLVPQYLQQIDLTASEWGSAQLCDFCQCVPLMSTIYGIVWCTFFILCARGGVGYFSDILRFPWRLIYPALAFTLVAAALTLLSTYLLSSGVAAFCAQFYYIFHTTECIQEIDHYTLAFYPKQVPASSLLKQAVLSSYICCAGWLLQLAILLLRIICVADFTLLKVVITAKREARDPEDILQIVGRDSCDYNETSLVTIFECQEEHDAVSIDLLASTRDVSGRKKKARKAFLSKTSALLPIPEENAKTSTSKTSKKLNVSSEDDEKTLKDDSSN